MRARHRTVIAIVAWSAIMLLSTAELYLYSLRSSDPAAFTWILVSQAPGWVMWAAVTGPIVALSRRFPLAWPPRARSLAVHAAACMTTAIGFTVIETFASRAFPWRRSEGEPVLVTLWHVFAGWLPFLILAYASVAGIGHALAYAEQARRERDEKAVLATQLVEAQLGALRMQLQPHFLFNTLNSVTMLIRSAEHARAVEMIAQLGDVLRALLRSSSDLETTLAAELDFLRRYLALEQVRFGERLSVRWSIDDQATAGLVPPLILQPLVENALRHGLWPRSDGGELAIIARRAGDDLELAITDQGIGLPPGFDLADVRGVGLANVRARLDRMYGSAAALEVGEGPGRGVSVRLRLPFHSATRLDGDARSRRG